MILGDLDIWEQAFKEMDLSENVQFVSRGRLITEASQVEMFNKIQALLNSNGMECSHKWLYSLDPSELNEAEATKVNNLYKLGIERGFIEDPDAEEPVIEEPAVEAPVAPAPAPAAPTPAPTSAFTVLYSAMRNGEIKSGESYSNAVSPRAAKADIISQLERAGYSNIKILAIECGDPDDCGKDCPNTYCAQANNEPIVAPNDQIPDYSEDAIPFEAEDEQVAEADDKADINKKNIDLIVATLQQLNNNIRRHNYDDGNIITVKYSALQNPNYHGNKAIITKILKSCGIDFINFNIRMSLLEIKIPDNMLLTKLTKTCDKLDKLIDAFQKNKSFRLSWLPESVDEADDKEADSEKSDDKEADSEKSDDKEADKEDKEADKKEEDAKEPDEKLKDDADDKAEKASDKEKEDKELDASEKTALKDSYKKAFKAAMQKCKFFDKSFDDLTLEEKVAFFTELSKAWGSKADPSKFMTDKEIQQLQTIVVKK